MATNKGAELLESLKTQGLSQREMLNRLDAIIDAESARPEGKRDRELIQACIDLQWFLTTGEHYTSKKEVARLKLDSALHKREKQTANGHGHSAKVLAAVFCLVAVVIVLPIAGQTLLSRKWIEGQTVDGGEVYQLNGQAVELDMLKKAIADRIDEDIEIKTSDFSALSGLIEVRSFGSSPAVGSSKIKMRGSLSMACAIPKRCFMPPEKVLILSRHTRCASPARCAAYRCCRSARRR